MPDTDLPLSTTVSEELAEPALYDHIREKVSDGATHISLLNARIEENDGNPQLVAVVFAAKESV